MADNEQVVNGIVMPPLYNHRAGQMWDIISAHVDFAGKRVVDLGCGHGDLLVRAYAAGARYIVGCDKFAYALTNTEEKIRQAKNIKKWTGNYRINLRLCDIELDDYWDYEYDTHWDIALCCSVLPYLKDPWLLLKRLQNVSAISVVECQYAGDGPGDFIKDDADMEKWLRSAGWSTVTAIGKTHVVERDKWRTIWKCER